MFFVVVCFVCLLSVCLFVFVFIRGKRGVSNNNRVYGNYNLVNDIGSGATLNYIYIRPKKKKQLVDIKTITPTIYIYYIIKKSLHVITGTR